MGKKKTVIEPEEIQHSPKYWLVKGYYDEGKWGKKAVKNAVGRGWIWVNETIDEYQMITGEAYTA